MVQVNDKNARHSEHKTTKIPVWVAEDLLAAEKGLCSKEFI